MSESRDYQELYWAWDAWRDEVGAPARQDYARYVELKNIGAQANGKSHTDTCAHSRTHNPPPHPPPTYTIRYRKISIQNVDIKL